MTKQDLKILAQMEKTLHRLLTMQDELSLDVQNELGWEWKFDWQRALKSVQSTKDYATTFYEKRSVNGQWLERRQATTKDTLNTPFEQKRTASMRETVL